MKKLVTPLLALVLAACSSSGNKETTQDSTAVLSDTQLPPVTPYSRKVLALKYVKKE